MEKTCCNCYHWFDNKCMNTEGRHFGVNMASDECCDSYLESFLKPKEERIDFSNTKNKCINCAHFIKEKCVNGRSKYYTKHTFDLLTCEEFEEKKEKKVEAVNHPSHYNKGIEAIDIIESWELNFSLGNAIKYILRAPHKGKQLEDLQKASWYINREIERLAKNGK